MKETTTSKEQILKRIRKAQIQNVSDTKLPNVDLESEVFKTTDDPLELVFAQQFTENRGNFVFCENVSDCANLLQEVLKENTCKSVYLIDAQIKQLLSGASLTVQNDLDHADALIAGCEQLVARTGTVYLIPDTGNGLNKLANAPLLIVIAFVSQVVFTHKEAFKQIRKKYNNQLPSYILTVSGNSSTTYQNSNGEEKTSNRDVFVFLIDG